MNKAQQFIDWVKLEEQKLMQHLPAIVKKYGDEGIYICNQIKKFLASPEATLVEAMLAEVIPGSWEASVVTGLTKAVSIALPLITGIEDHANLSLAKQVEALLAYLRTLSPKMQHAAIGKLLSQLFQAIDPSIPEVNADTAAQIVYQNTATK